METITKRLRCGESIPSVVSTKRRVHGPAIVDITTYDDGGMHMHIKEATPDLYCGQKECGTCDPE